MNTRLRECLESSLLSARQKSAFKSTTHKHTIAGAEYSQPVPGVRLIKARSFEQEVAESEGRGGVMWLAWSGGDLAWLTGQTLEVR